MNDHRKTIMNFTRVRTIAAGVSLVVLATSSTTLPTARAGAGVTLAISQVPLTVASPVHPQVLIALGNSESMDGTLSGAIMTGSGVLASGITSLSGSSSPANYAVPSGFVPPMQAADTSGNAPYTVSSNGNLVDNGASRLNVAKAGIKAIIQAYMQNTDFALETYSTSGTSLYTTWVYYMSPPGSGFVFTSSKLAGNRYVANPCLNYSLASSTVKSNCTAIAGAGLYTALAVSGSAYMQIGASSDDANINDVLYASGQPGVYINYGNTSPASPYPPSYSLANYNNGSILITYPSSVPSANRATGPTNAGYVPYSPQVMYAQRGFGYGGSQSASSGNVLVPMTSAGAVPTATTVTIAVNSFLPSLAPETNTLQTTEIKAVAGQAPTAGLLAKAQSYLASVLSTAVCAPKQYVVLISDGLPTQDLAGKYWPPLGSAAAAGYGLTATFKADGSLNVTNDTALTDTITNLAKLKAAGINTYVIGLGAGVDPSVNPQAAATLQAMAIAGGTANYYPASSPAALVDGLNSILISVQSGALSTTAAAVNSSQLQAGSVEYQASFNSNDTPYQDWTGELFEKAIDPATGLPTGAVLWSAQTLLDTKASGTGWSTNRLITTWNPALNAGAGAAAPFRWASLSAAQQALLQPSDTLGASRVDYLRGNSLLEKRNGGTFRNRSHVLGDIVNSQPAYVGAPSASYFSDSYRSFAKSKASRQAMLYSGANDGMLHAFNATTGVEQFAFIPNDVVANLRKLTDPLYNQSHLYFVDGAPQVGDVQFADASWHTLLVAGEGGGGKSIYAMDVTNPQTLTSEAAVASAVLWEFTDADMGLSYSEPQISPIVAAPGFAVFFGNGYNSANNKSVLYAVNPKTGATLRKIDLCAAVSGACDSNLPQGLSTVALGNSDGLQGPAITHIYAGDLQGNLWAIDVADADPSRWAARLLFKARDASGNLQPITTPPVVTLHPNYPRLLGQFVMFGTGQLLAAVDLSSQLKQSVYGIWDKPGNTSVPTRSNLQVQTLALVSAGASGLPQDVLTASKTAINWTNKLGWYEDLVGNGERIINAPQLLNGAFLATLNTPPVSGVCGASFSASLLEVNFQTGGAFEQPQLDINGDKVIDARDTINGTFPVGVVLGSGYGSSATLLQTTGAPGKIGKLITKSGGQQVTIIDPNNTPRRLTWWQLQ
ncbi:PilC/PilY family type IV pilus protein [Actimicrobium sp. CCC2.4]|uniref:pilus assembly protein n=1 Tax=Actimicrobium sp. CCC2.4 TaxID=3048606 RepID=UPI002AC96C0A|nr:PilC/PilY family type IV pilus protein [Actimicrobium sp. CCC2.4]MEB0135126.1 PilC/PilY family type IV pilus protein [Actimicrobium sp. CCC2.4]WPX31829.1 PilC/PilY family type IV pilus protein [Actimicrobium sp. CCC2.4]